MNHACLAKESTRINARNAFVVQSCYLNGDFRTWEAVDVELILQDWQLPASQNVLRGAQTVQEVKSKNVSCVLQDMNSLDKT